MVHDQIELVNANLQHSSNYMYRPNYYTWPLHCAWGEERRSVASSSGAAFAAGLWEWGRITRNRGHITVISRQSTVRSIDVPTILPNTQLIVVPRLIDDCRWPRIDMFTSSITSISNSGNMAVQSYPYLLFLKERSKCF